MARDGDQTSRWRPTVSGAVAVLALVISAFTLWHEYQRDEAARDSAARAARHDVIANVLEMGRYDAEGGAANQGQIVVLASDAEQLIREFGQERLGLSTAVYRLLAEYVAYSTRNEQLAERLAGHVLDVAGEGDEVEEVYAHRVLGDVAAQLGDPEGLVDEYQEALVATEGYRERDAVRALDVDRFTKAFRLLSAYLGASLSVSRPALQAEFCDLTREWAVDWPLVEELRTRGRILGQLRRLNAKQDLAQLETVCADSPPSGPGEGGNGTHS
jgi:hypothetical protein